MTLKVVSWNLHNKIDAWNYLFDEFNPHIGLLQESPQLPSDYDTNLIISFLKGHSMTMKNQIKC